jgi:hypothetical protein
MDELWEEHVLPHGAIEQIANDLWQVTGTLERNPLPRNMVIWRLPSGGLMVHSAICLNDTEMKRLDALGTVEIIVVPCRMHKLDASRYADRYPNAKILSPACAQDEVGKVVKVTGSIEDELPHHGIAVHRPKGLRDFELHLEIPLNEDETAMVFTDALFNLRDEPPKGFSGFILKLFGSVGPLGITSIGKRMLLEDKQSFKSYLQELATIKGLTAICVAHGSPIRENAAEQMRLAAERL